jgi:hypothetical protein
VVPGAHTASRRAAQTLREPLAGWLILVAGLLRMALPEAPQPRDGLLATLVIAFVLGYGSLLTWLGYRPFPPT